MTRSDLEQAVYRRLGKNTASVDSATQTRIRHFLNQRHRRILAMPGLSHLRNTTTTFASVAGTSNYDVSGVFAVKRIFETTNDWTLERLSLEEYRRINPDPSASQSTPTHWVPITFNDGVLTIHLHPRPSAVITYTVEYTAIITDFAADSSEPLIPEEFQFVLELGAAMDELVKTDDTRYLVWAAEYDQGLKDLLYWVASQTYAPAMQRSGRSSLGPWYPSGT